MYEPSDRNRPRIVLTNDDGYRAPGIRALGRALSKRYEVLMVAPEEEQSGVGHSFTYRRRLRCREVEDESFAKTVVVSGTPVDCVKFALSAVVSEQPALVVSGMNVGENTGISGFYSGTVGAAREGAFWGVPSIALSLATGGEGHLDAWCRSAADFVTAWHGTDLSGFSVAGGSFFLNVNFPGLAPDSVRGVRITRQSMAYFTDRYVAVGRVAGETLYELRGEKRDIEQSDDYDSRAIDNGWITVTPLHYDATADAVMEMSDEMKTTFCAGKEWIE